MATFNELVYTIDLRNGSPSTPPSPFIDFVVTPEDSNNDTWFETVLKINVDDPSLNNPYDIVEFEVEYDGTPIGMSVNIGDSITNNGFAGDGFTQTNDAEMQIGGRADLSDHGSLFDDLRVYGNDNTNRDVFTGALLQEEPDLVAEGSQVNITVANEFVGWDNNQGESGSRSSPLLFALDGQSDSEGAVNYDIFAAFNRVISGNRPGSGVGQVTIRLRDLDAPISESVDDNSLFASGEILPDVIEIF